LIFIYSLEIENKGWNNYTSLIFKLSLVIRNQKKFRNVGFVKLKRSIADDLLLIEDVETLEFNRTVFIIALLVCQLVCLYKTLV